MNKAEKIKCFDAMAGEYSSNPKRGRYYHGVFERYMRFIIPEGSTVINIGSGTGELLDALNPSEGVGLDISPAMVREAGQRHPRLKFIVGDIEAPVIEGKFDYILLTNVIGYVDDIQKTLETLCRFARPDTRIVIGYFNYLWEPVLRIGELFGLRTKRPMEHWLPVEDIENLLALAGFEVIKRDRFILMPVYIPLISAFLNRIVARMPVFRRFALNWSLIARMPKPRRELSAVSASVIVPCRNEKGNIEPLVKRLPLMGSRSEIIFVEGHSDDGTREECERVKALYPDRNISVIAQEGAGKRDAVYAGFAKAKNDLLMILDADLTVVPEDMPKFFDAITSGKGEFVNGSRMVYQMERQAMRRLNHIANKFFSVMFTYLLGQRLRDTLCGTKVLWKEDFARIEKGRGYFGDFDPFGDFDLLFGAAKLNLKIVEIPVKYRARSYGTTQIERFKHGWLLIKMVCFAMRKIKFI